MSRSVFHRAGLDLSVLKTGEGQPFIFQHGLCGDANQPADVFPGDAGWSCLTVECRGHGQSQAGDTDKFSIATFADDIATYIEANRLGPVVIGGISMGAAISLRLAVKRPDLVKALVLARPAWVSAADPQNMRPNAEVGALLQTEEPAAAREAFLKSATALHLQETAPDNLASLKGFFAREPIAVTAALLTRISADGPGVSEAEIAAIKIPTLVIGHDHDEVHPFAHAETLASMIPGARLVRITAKVKGIDAYRHDFKTALSSFLSGQAA